jgi:osmotically-inducible protein OsmY
MLINNSSNQPSQQASKQSSRRLRPLHATAFVAAAFAAATMLAACDRTDDGRTAGQKVDSAVASAKQKMQSARNDIAQGSDQARRDIRDATKDAKDAIGDATITASVNAKLAGDKELSALQINVDTVDGRVALHGSAPNSAARDRATQLASSVDGVRSVENQLVVGSKS